MNKIRSMSKKERYWLVLYLIGSYFAAKLAMADGSWFWRSFDIAVLVFCTYRAADIWVRCEPKGKKKGKKK